MVSSLARFAALGGTPAFAEPRHVGAPNLPGREEFLARLTDLLDRRWLTNRGPLVLEFEQRLAEVLGVQHVVATCNATLALEIAARALGFRGQAVVPAWTFVATAHALRWQEVHPRFADVDPITHGVDPRSVTSQFTPQVSGIVGVHLWGNPCRVDELEQLAASRGVPLLLDAAHALGCAYEDGTPVGGRGDAEVFSFHATKFLNTFEGGAIATNDGDLAERCRLMTNFGFMGRDRVEHVGTNGKMSEVAAAMGLTSLDHIDEVVDHNRRNLHLYRSGLEDLDGLRLVEPASDRHNHQYVVVEVHEERCGITRDELVTLLEAENVQARRYFSPGVHRMEPYRSEQPHADLLLPETERLARCTMVLPTGTAMEGADVLRVAAVVRDAVEHGPAVAAALRARVPADDRARTAG